MYYYKMLSYNISSQYDRKFPGITLFIHRKLKIRSSKVNFDVGQFHLKRICFNNLLIRTLMYTRDMNCCCR